MNNFYNKLELSDFEAMIADLKSQKKSPDTIADCYNRAEFILDLFFKDAPISLLNDNLSYFRKHAQEPLFERLYCLNSIRTNQKAERIEFLCKAGINPNCIFNLNHIIKKDTLNMLNLLGTTPIMNCIEPKIIKVLLNYGADVYQKSEKKKVFAPFSDPPQPMKYTLSNGEEYIKELAEKKIIPASFYSMLKVYNENRWLRMAQLHPHLYHAIYEEKNAIEIAKKASHLGKLKVIQDFFNEEKNANQKEALVFNQEQKTQYEELKEYQNSIPEAAYKLLVSGLKENNLLILEHIDEFKTLIQNQKDHGKNLIFYAIDFNKRNWFEILWSKKWLDENAENKSHQTYLEFAIGGKKAPIVDFLIKNTNFAKLSEEQVNKIKKNAFYYAKGKRLEIIQNLDKLRESHLLQETTSENLISRKIKMI